MVKRTLKAFSLAEMIMAMVVIMIASVAALPALTQQKPNIPQTTIRGQYACWIYDGKHYEQRCEERACEDVKQKDCSFTLDSRPAHFFIAAVGKSANYTEQQVILVDNPTISSDLKITIKTERQKMVTEKAKVIFKSLGNYNVEIKLMAGIVAKIVVKVESL